MAVDLMVMQRSCLLEMSHRTMYLLVLTSVCKPLFSRLCSRYNTRLWHERIGQSRLSVIDMGNNTWNQSSDDDNGTFKETLPHVANVSDLVHQAALRRQPPTYKMWKEEGTICSMVKLTMVTEFDEWNYKLEVEMWWRWVCAEGVLKRNRLPCWWRWRKWVENAEEKKLKRTAV